MHTYGHIRAVAVEADALLQIQREGMIDARLAQDLLAMESRCFSAASSWATACFSSLRLSSALAENVIRQSAVETAIAAFDIPEPETDYAVAIAASVHLQARRPRST